MRYTSLIATLSHDNNHRTSKHASTSWRSDGSPSCLGGSSHGWVLVKTHSTPVPTSVLANSTTHNNEPKKTQHNDNKRSSKFVVFTLIWIPPPFYTTIYRKNEIWMPGTQGKREVEISGAQLRREKVRPSF